MNKPSLLLHVTFERVIEKNVNPKSCYRAFVPTNFVKLNRYILYFFLHKKYYNIEVMISKTLHQNLSFKVLKELSCSWNGQSFEKDNCWFFSLSDFYLFFKKSNRRLEFNDTGFFSFVSKKEVRHGYRGCGGHVCFAKYTLNLSYIYPIFSSKNILFSYIILVKSGLTPCNMYVICLNYLCHFFVK